MGISLLKNVNPSRVAIVFNFVREAFYAECVVSFNGVQHSVLHLIRQFGMSFTRFGVLFRFIHFPLEHDIGTGKTTLIR